MLFGILCMIAIQALLTVALFCHSVELRRDVLINVQTLLRKVAIMSAALDDLKAAVAAQTSLDASAVTLIQGIADKLSNMPAGTSDADLKALADELRTGAAPLAAAVATNTQAAPAA